MNRIDGAIERYARALARRSDRRSFLARFGAWVVGAAAFPLLPVARGTAAATPSVHPAPAEVAGPAGDPTRCEYWRHCAIDGFLCSCCGGSQTSCPPGTEMSPLTWIGTCRNPADGKDYAIWYNDCCGRSFCGRCFCNRNEGDMPMYVPPKNNDTNWCQGTQSNVYHSTIAAVVGVAVEK